MRPTTAISAPARVASARAAGSTTGALEAVGARTQVTLRVDRATAEGTRCAPRGDDPLGALAERARLPGPQADQEDLLRLRLVDLLLGLVGRDDRLLGEREDLHHDGGVGGIP